MSNVKEHSSFPSLVNRTVDFTRVWVDDGAAEAMEAVSVDITWS